MTVRLHIMRLCTPSIWPALARANKYSKARNREARRDEVFTSLERETSPMGSSWQWSPTLFTSLKKKSLSAPWCATRHLDRSRVAIAVDRSGVQSLVTLNAVKHANVSLVRDPKPEVTVVFLRGSCIHFVVIVAFPSTSVGNLNELPCSRHRFTSRAMNYVRSISKAIC
ncbi:hypothetical protein EAG_03575 [Camponotus floridanus]|uniref:Uncharacterized protein n=1 Tax=Camponotus floridanus TaxID=104421 RepID=E2ANX3_CAMFO|nr:hypothetical protein EAG_03575 [Camponotus floridanus]